MNVGMIGLGKLGLPVAIAMISRGVQVHGYDQNAGVWAYQRDPWSYPHQESGLLPGSALQDEFRRVYPDHCARPAEVCARARIIFVAVQTPHQPKFGGAEPLPDERADFDYSHLRAAVASLAPHVTPEHIVVVISTCLPGTMRREIVPLLSGKCRIAYSPLYIAMGTVIPDYLSPEYNLLGVDADSRGCVEALQELFALMNTAPNLITDIATAEAIKVFYNTAITQKIILANAHMQVAHKLRLNIDDINRGLMMAGSRVVSARYMRSGGPDAGGCHPRDLIALSWLGEQIDLWPNWFEMMAQARDAQTDWTADLIADAADEHPELPVYILGKSFKPETRITDGPGALLLGSFLAAKGVGYTHWDPKIDAVAPDWKQGIYFIATQHKEFESFEFPIGSIVFDLWRFIGEPLGCKYVPIGRLND